MSSVRLVLMCVFLYCALVVGDHDGGEDSAIQYRPGQCLPGDKHKELPCPEPEGPDYQACFQWSDETCCTAELTQQLGGSVVDNVDGFRWDTCGPLSQSCHDFFANVECFYRCSPHVAHWRNLEYDSALKHLPICREFCDDWFDACASDLTCATNWIFEWINVNGTNLCRNNTVCRNFTEVYGSGQGLCETLWGESFLYSSTSQSDPDRQCMTLTWGLNETNPNEVAIRNIFGSLVDTVQPAECGARGVSVWGALVSLMTVWAAVMLL